MSRIVAGAARGRRLRTPTGDRTRPTTDRVREALFSSLLSERGTLEGARFLDLYAGTGAVGLEALSRGASAAVLVEHDARTCAVLRSNVAAVGLPGAVVLRRRVRSHLDRPPDEPYDVVFADPPYEGTAAEVDAVLVSLVAPGWLSGDAIVVVERSVRDADLTWPPGLAALRERAYGETVLCYGHRHA